MKSRIQVGLFIGEKHYDDVKREMLITGELLDKTTLEFVLIGRKNGVPFQKAKSRGLKRVGLGKSSMRSDFNAALKFANILKEEEISTLIFRDHRETVLLVTTKFLMKGRLRLIYIQDRPLADMKRDFLHTFRFNQIDAWLTPLNYTAIDVKRGTNLDHEKVHQIPLPIERKQFEFSDENRFAAKKVLFGQGDEIITIGWHLPNASPTSFDTARTLAGIMKLDERIRLCLNGLQDHLDTLLKEFPTSTGFKDRIVVWSYQVYDPKFYEGLDACMIDPEFEPFLGVAYRAMLSGTIPISRKCLLGNELFDNGKLCIEYEKNSSSSSQEILSQLSDGGRITLIKENMRGHLGKRLTKKRFKENLEALIRALPKKSVAR